jgi:integrase
MKSTKATGIPSVRKTTLRSLTKIPSVAGLYRHDNGNYYGKKKVGKNKKVLALTTADGANISDRKIAEKALVMWIASLQSPAKTQNEMTFADWWKKFLAQKSGQAAKTQKKCTWVKQCIDLDFPEAWRMRVVDFKPSHLAEFFAKRRGMAANTYNGLTMHIKNVFEIAVADDIISSSPYEKVTKEVKRKKQSRTPDRVPTIEQCEALVAHVRGQEFADTADKSADMLALMHMAALGQAELIALDWQDVRWEEGNIIIWERKKTGAYFEVPFYQHLKPFLIDLWERHGKPTSGKIISILTPAIALANACKRLKLERYSPRDLRKARIVWMLRKGVPVETIAKWQGHKDNGVLIRRTYAWVITSLDKSFEEAQLAKLV